MAKVKLVAIAAVSVDGVIGVGNTIPWNIPEDFKHFRKTTIDNTLIVGSNTFHTLPEKALENRNFLVLNGGDGFECDIPNVRQFSSSDELLAMIEVCLTVCLTSMTHGVTIVLPHRGAKEI